MEEITTDEIIYFIKLMDWPEKMDRDGTYACTCINKEEKMFRGICALFISDDSLGVDINQGTRQFHNGYWEKRQQVKAYLSLIGKTWLR